MIDTRRSSSFRLHPDTTFSGDFVPIFSIANQDNVIQVSKITIESIEPSPNSSPVIELYNEQSSQLFCIGVTQVHYQYKFEDSDLHIKIISISSDKILSFASTTINCLHNFHKSTFESLSILCAHKHITLSNGNQQHNLHVTNRHIKQRITHARTPIQIRNVYNNDWDIFRQSFKILHQHTTNTLQISIAKSYKFPIDFTWPSTSSTSISKLHIY